jgi:hypothetical protein
LVKERGMKAHEECKTEAAKSVRSRFGGGETSARKRKRMDETWDGDCGSEELMNDGGVKEHTGPCSKGRSTKIKLLLLLQRMGCIGVILW